MFYLKNNINFYIYVCGICLICLYYCIEQQVLFWCCQIKMTTIVCQQICICRETLFHIYWCNRNISHECYVIVAKIIWERLFRNFSFLGYFRNRAHCVKSRIFLNTFFNFNWTAFTWSFLICWILFWNSVTIWIESASVRPNDSKQITLSGSVPS